MIPSLFLLDDDSLELLTTALFFGKEGEFYVVNDVLSLGSLYLILLLRSTLLMLASSSSASGLGTMSDYISYEAKPSSSLGYY